VQKLLIVLAWGALVAWAVRPVPGRGIPVGRRWARVYLSGRQALVIGGSLLAASLLMAGLAWARRDGDLALVAVCLGWLGALLVLQGRRI
jgi:hypothetical protein